VIPKTNLWKNVQSEKEDLNIIQIIVAVIALVFFCAVVSRAARIARMPVHLRWELYPVPHEKERARYGGSILEEVNWWTKKPQHNPFGQWAVMIPEIFLLKGVWEHHRSLWWGSYPLHLGLYLLSGNIGLLALNTVLDYFGVSLLVILSLVGVIAWAGCAVGTIGSLIMLYKRLFDPRLIPFSNAAHYFNILILGSIYGAGLWWLATDASFVSHISGFYAGLIQPSQAVSLPLAAWIHIGLALFFILYMPFTHMSHFFTKYFLYHSVKWEDTPNLPGKGIQEKVTPYLMKTVTWAAPHIGADGKKNWVDIVTSGVPSKAEEKH